MPRKLAPEKAANRIPVIDAMAPEKTYAPITTPSLSMPLRKLTREFSPTARSRRPHRE